MKDIQTLLAVRFGQNRSEVQTKRGSISDGAKDAMGEVVEDLCAMNINFPSKLIEPL